MILIQATTPSLILGSLGALDHGVVRVLVAVGPVVEEVAWSCSV